MSDGFIPYGRQIVDEEDIDGVVDDAALAARLQGRRVRFASLAFAQ